MVPLVDRLGDPVRKETLLDAGWSGAPSGIDGLNVRIHRLRVRIGPIGLQLINIRGRGYVLERLATDEPTGR